MLSLRTLETRELGVLIKMFVGRGEALSIRCIVSVDTHLFEKIALHMYPSEDAERPLAHATLVCKNSNE